MPLSHTYRWSRLYQRTVGTRREHWISPLAALPCFIQETTNWFHQETIGPECHAELSRSAASTDYVWKEDTRVDGTPFELGTIAY